MKSSSEETSIPAPQTLQHNDDYWIREGTHSNRVHAQSRNALYTPEQADDISKLTPYGSTLAKSTSGERLNRFDDEWTEPRRDLQFTWTGFISFDEKEAYREALDTSEDEHRPQQALRAKAVKAPVQPTPQERAEHELTHLPSRSWCTLSLQSKGRRDHHKTQQSRHLVIQCDFAYIKGN